MRVTAGWHFPRTAFLVGLELYRGSYVAGRTSLILHLGPFLVRIVR
jgi:hypothetical protein